MMMNKIKDFVLKDKFLLALLSLDLIIFIFGNFNYAIVTLVFFLIFITATYLLVLFEKYNTKIFIIGIAIFVISFLFNVFNENFSTYSPMVFGISLIAILILLFILPQSFLLLILKHIKLFERQNAIIKTLIIDAVIFIPYLMLFGFAIPSL